MNIIRIKSAFCILVQDIERYHFLFKKAKSSALFKEQFIEHREHYLKELLRMDSGSRHQLLSEHVIKDSDETHHLLEQLIQQYCKQYGYVNLFRIVKPQLQHYLISDQNIYEISRQLQKTPEVQQYIREYELKQQNELQYVDLNKLLRHVVICEKLEINEAPLATFNLIHYNLIQRKDQYLYEIVHYLRSIKSDYSQLPLAVWSVIFDRMDSIQQQDLSLVCQLLQQYGLMKLQNVPKLRKILSQLIHWVQKSADIDTALLELLRTVNILNANGIDVGNVDKLHILCNTSEMMRKHQFDREFSLFTGMKQIQEPSVMLDEEHVNRQLTALLQSDLTNIEDKQALREYVMNALTSTQDNITLKKAMVLGCQVWPNDIQVVAKCGREIKKRLEVFDRETLSLAVNSLYQFKRVQYPMLDSQLLKYIASSDIMSLNPQEVSSLFYYISQSLPKLSRKELLKVVQGNHKYNQDICTILINIMPVLQKYCSKGVLRLKVLYTITDCYAKYGEHLNTDLSYLFEKVEYNFMRELELKYQCGNHLEEKDVRFMRMRFIYMKVGSRKLMRFFEKAKTNYYRAIKVYLMRERVYEQMKTRRRTTFKEGVQQ